MTLHQKTKQIIEESIKSAIFIDEKALEFYKPKPIQTYPEIDLSINLYKNFKKKGVSLAVHKFKVTDIENDEVLNYFFKRRDLILLDWKLNGNDGEEYSLNLLSKVVKEKHIHFCSIFTSEHNLDIILNNIITYFSGYTIAYYQRIVEALEIYREVNIEAFNQISFDNKTQNGKLYTVFSGIDQSLPKLIRNITGINDFASALFQVSFAFSNFHKSSTVNPIPLNVSRENYTLNINNTIITIIPKTENSAVKILNKLVNQIKKSENNFSQLLGLDMQNNFSNKASFIDGNLLKTNLDTLMYHRKQLINNSLDLEFNNFIKSIMIEHSKLKLDESDLKILEQEFLERISKARYNIKNEEIAKLNTFYNGTILRNKSLLNFGDIFKDEQNNYYLCITALCDCILHNGQSNIDYNYFFVKGSRISLTNAIAKGDGGFISYIDKNTCISWTSGEYVKPRQYFVPKPQLVDNQIQISFWDADRKISSISLSYIFTLKQNYAQRIANHSFNHPIRVGVDFVKTK